MSTWVANPLAQPHHEDVVDRRRTIEEQHPAYIKYRENVQEAWRLYQSRLETARFTRDTELPPEEMMAMIRGEKKMSFLGGEPP